MQGNGEIHSIHIKFCTLCGTTTYPAAMRRTNSMKSTKYKVVETDEHK